MDRRRFLETTGRWVGASLAGTWLPAARPPAAAAASAASHPDLVSVTGAPRPAVHRALATLGGLGRFLAPGQVVVIKPNASFLAPPEWGATTHPQVLRGLLEACFEAEARRVLVVDHTMGTQAERCFERTGIAATVAAFEKAKLVSLDRERAYETVAVPAGESLHETAIATAVRKADLFINLPTAKSHAATGVSFGLKNLMGLVWDRQVFHSSMDIHVGIADLATVLRPQLTILDAVHLLQTGGPAGPGEVETLNRVIAGVDPVAVDAYAVGLTHWNRQILQAEQIPFLQHAARRGIGTLAWRDLTLAEIEA